MIVPVFDRPSCHHAQSLGELRDVDLRRLFSVPSKIMRLLLFLILCLACCLIFVLFYRHTAEHFSGSNTDEKSCEQQYQICLDDRLHGYLTQQVKRKEKYGSTDNDDDDDDDDDDKHNHTDAKCPTTSSSDVRSPTSTEVRSPTSTSTEVRSPTSTSTEVRSPTSTSTEVRSPTSTSTEVRSPTSTSTEVRSPTSTSTDAYTQGNVTVTGGAGDGATSVTIYTMPVPQPVRADAESDLVRSKVSATRMQEMIKET
jgi:hypothetical protein